MFSPFLAHHTVQRGGVYASVQRKGTCDNVLFLLWKGIEDSFLLPGQFCRIVVPAPVISHEDHRDVFQAVLSCSRTFELEKFVKEKRKMINSRVWFSLGNCQEIWKGPGLKPAWLGKIMEKNIFKKMVSSYKEEKKEI